MLTQRTVNHIKAQPDPIKAIEGMIAGTIKRETGHDVEITVMLNGDYTVSGDRGSVAAVESFLIGGGAIPAEATVYDEELDESFAYFRSPA